MSAQTTRETLKETCEVLVVGAGPTGLMAANLLKRRGVDVRLVEQRAAASSESRAFAIQARSVELFEHMGIVDEFLAQGVLNPGVEFYVGKRHLGGLNFDKAASPDTPYGFIFMLPQSHTEAILIKDSERLGLEVECEVTVTGLTQDEGGVSVQATTKGGRERTIRSRYVVGADGAHSVVRKALGLSFEGSRFQAAFLLADCQVHWPLDHAHFRVFMNGGSTAFFLPLGGANRSRVMTTDRRDKGRDKHSSQVNRNGPNAASSELGLKELETAFQAVTDMDVTLSDAV